MSWIEFLQDARSVRAIYGDVIPNLSEVEVHEIRFDTRGSSVILRLDLANYPLNPPRKWVEQQANTVQTELHFSEVRDVELSGWGTERRASLHIDEAPGSGYEVACIGASRLMMVARWIAIRKISAYQGAPERGEA